MIAVVPFVLLNTRTVATAVFAIVPNKIRKSSADTKNLEICFIVSNVVVVRVDGKWSKA
jgi:hypothetical protein